MNKSEMQICSDAVRNSGFNYNKVSSSTKTAFHKNVGKLHQNPTQKLTQLFDASYQSNNKTIKNSIKDFQEDSNQYYYQTNGKKSSQLQQQLSTSLRNAQLKTESSETIQNSPHAANLTSQTSLRPVMLNSPGSIGGCDQNGILNKSNNNIQQRLSSFHLHQTQAKFLAKKNFKNTIQKFFCKMDNSYFDTYQQTSQLISQIEDKKALQVIKSQPGGGEGIEDDYDIEDLLNKLRPQRVRQTLQIKSGSISSKELQEGQHNIFDCQAMEYAYFCIAVKGKACPLRLSIHLSKPSKFIILISFSNPNPSKFNCDKISSSNRFQLYPLTGSQQIFNNMEKCFFAFVSKDETNMKIKFSFGTDESTYDNRTVNFQLSQQQQFSLATASSPNKLDSKSNQYASNYNKFSNDQIIASRISRRKLLQKQIWAEIQIPNEKLMEEVLKIKSKHKNQRHYQFQSSEKDGCGNLIAANKQNLQQYNVYNQRNSQKLIFQQHNQRIWQANKTKKFLDESALQSKIQQFAEKDQAKFQKSLIELEQIKQFKANAFAFYWITDLVAALFIRKLYRYFIGYKRRQKMIREMAFLLLRPLIHYKVKMNKLGGNPTIRIMNATNTGLRVDVKMWKKQHKKKVGQILKYVFGVNQESFKIKFYIMRFYNVIVKVQTNYRARKQKLFFFKKLIEKLWDKYFLFAVNTFIEVIPTSDDPEQNKRRRLNILFSYNTPDVKKIFIDKFILARQKAYREQIRKMINYQYKNINILKAFCNEQVDQNLMVLDNLALENKSENKNKIMQEADIIIELNDRNYTTVTQQNLIPRIFKFPNYHQLRYMMYEAALLKNNQYPDLMDKVIIRKIELNDF